MKQTVDRSQRSAARMREDRKASLMGKYFDLFCSDFEYEGISYAKFRKIMAALWIRGTLLAVPVKGAKEVADALGEEELMFGICDYSSNEWDIDGFPLKVTCDLPTTDGQMIGGVPVTASIGQPTNQSLLPIGEKLTVGNDCVVGFGLPSLRPIQDFVEQTVNYIIDAEVAIRNNQIAMGMQTTIVTTKDSFIRAKNLEDQIMNGEPVKLVSAKTLESVAFPASGISDFTDGQYKLKMNYENELKTYLGIRNIGNIEKKERVNVDEAASNNEESDIGSDGIARMIDEFCKGCGEVLKTHFTIKRRKNEVEKPMPEDDEEEEGDDENASEE